MTDLTRPVRRKTNTSYRGRAIIVELRGGSIDTLFLREAGRRTGYAVPIEKIFQLGARMEAESKRKERLEKRKLKKQQGRKER